MRIIIVNFNIGGFAGDAIQMLMVARGLMERGHDVTIVTTDVDSYYFDKDKSKQYSVVRKKLLEAKGQIVIIEGVPVYPIHGVTPRFGMYSPSAPRIVKKLLQNCDVVYIINWYYHLAAVFSKLAYEYKVPFVIAAHGALQEKARNIKKREKWILDKIYTNNMIKHASGFHSVGHLETEEYIKMGAIPDRIYLIDHGVILDNFKIKNRTNILERIGINPKIDEYLFYVGRIDPKKGIDLLVRAFARLRKNHHNLILLIAGTGLTSYVHEIRELVTKLNLDNFVKFTGFITNDEKLELFQSAKLFVLTSRSDVHPVSVQESLVMGVPVLITKSSDFPEVEEYNAGLLVESDVDSIYDGLLKILTNREKLSEMSQNARRLINEKFLLENKIEEYERMFQEVISKHSKEKQH